MQRRQGECRRIADRTLRVRGRHTECAAYDRFGQTSCAIVGWLAAVALGGSGLLWVSTTPAGQPGGAKPPAAAGAPATKDKPAPEKPGPAPRKPAPAGAERSPSATPRPAAVKPQPADNSYCYVCHLNYEDEQLAKGHQPAGVGCEKCHGASVKHSGDEDGLTPPDTMYPKSEIVASCLKCHPQDALIDEADHARFFAELAKAKDKPAAQKTCTDCHGKEHRLKVRTRIWDKRTRKLLSDDGVRMMSDKPAADGAKPQPQPGTP